MTVVQSDVYGYISTNLAWLKSLSLPLSSPDTDTTRLFGANCLQKYHNIQLSAIWSWNDVFWVYIYTNLYKIFIFGWFSWPLYCFTVRNMCTTFRLQGRCIIQNRSVAIAGENRIKEKKERFFFTLLISHIYHYHQ